MPNRKEDLAELINFSSDKCLSIYMPLINSWPESQQNPIKFKNLLSEAENKLSTKGISSSQANEILEQAEERAQDEKFWNCGQNGLAIFCAPGLCRSYHVPEKFEEISYLGKHFYIIPILSTLRNNSKFYLLSLSQKKTTFYEGNRHGLKAVDVPNMPISLAEALKYDDPEESLNFHQSQSGSKAPIYHGNAASSEDNKNEIMRFFQQVEKAVSEKLKTEKAPLILAGVDYLLPIYRDVNSYKHLFPEGITGNYDANKPNHEEILLEKAWNILQKNLNEQLDENINSFHSKDKTSDKIQEIIEGAYYGKIDTLFIQENAQLCGEFNAKENQLKLRDSQENGYEDILNLTALQTLNHGGEVIILEQEKMPNNSMVAATFRY